VRRLRVATRGSALARWQADHVAALLGGDVEIVVVSTLGDRDKKTSLDRLGGRGVFTKEVQEAVLDGRADLAVHSCKDLPSAPELQPDGLVVACVPERGDPRDALVGGRLDDLAPGAPIATDSARRRAQLADLRPDLTFTELRGNIDTRLAKVPRGGAVVVAHAALVRLGLADRADEVLEPQRFVPQVGQGALAVECRTDDDEVVARLATVEHASSRRAVDTERAWLAELGGGCDLPVGAHATVGGDGDVRLDALLASLDGRIVLRTASEGDDPVELGRSLARSMLEQGGSLLSDV
jgi:hydroxymethylbilane synthase